MSEPQITENITVKILGQFGHHPDPIIDFEVEVDALQGIAYDVEYGVRPTIGDAVDLLTRANKALAFRFVPGGPCQKTMDALCATIYPLEDRLIAAAVLKGEANG